MTGIVPIHAATPVLQKMAANAFVRAIEGVDAVMTVDTPPAAWRAREQVNAALERFFDSPQCHDITQLARMKKMLVLLDKMGVEWDESLIPLRLKKYVLAEGKLTKVTCTRCGGGGSYSYNLRDGTKCYGCNGTGFQFKDLEKYGKVIAARASSAEATRQKMEATKAFTEKYAAELAQELRITADRSTVKGMWDFNNEVFRKTGTEFYKLRDDAMKDITEELLAEDDYVTSKRSGNSYMVKHFNPERHIMVEPKITRERARELENVKTAKRTEQAHQQLAAVPKPDIQKLMHTKVDVPVGPKSEKDAIGTNPQVEKKIATRMAQLGKAVATFVTEVKSLTKELRSQHPEWSDKELASAARKKAQEEGLVAPPEFDLCTVTVPGTNLFCSGNKEIPRDQMPQLKTKAVKGTQAWSLAKQQAEAKGRDPNEVEVDAEPAFLKFLSDRGIKIMHGDSVPATELKATQNQLNADKVAGMAWALMTDPSTKSIDHPLRRPLIVSEDGYILDGHHRWAALATFDIMNGKEDAQPISVIRVKMDIEDLVDESNTFGDEFGLQRKGMGAASQGVSSNSEPKGGDFKREKKKDKGDRKRNKDRDRHKKTPPHKEHVVENHLAEIWQSLKRGLEEAR